MYLLKYNKPLRLKEPDMPPWGTIHSKIYNWTKAGIMQQILQIIGDKEINKNADKRIPSLKRYAVKSAQKKMI